ncbi:MAG TPA: peptidase S10 [Chloroflexaceae bacterium]|nr:peptidase S10 [Chloroflexaceae bacterium]
MAEQTSGAAPPEPPRDRLVETKHRVVVGGRELRYTATAGTIVLREESSKDGEGGPKVEPEQARAAIFFVAYTLDGVADRRTRPVTFAFNGGPGSSSGSLHPGLVRPKVAPMDDAGRPPPPPYRLADNEHSLLEVSDLVFIDPVSTGYSRVLPGEAAGQFHGFRRDIEAVGDFIRLYTTRYGRWVSPKFLAGESYGTTRAAGLAGYLQDRHGLYLNGLMLISAVLSFQTLEFEPGNDLPYMLFLPSYTATAFYHGALPDELRGDLRAALAEAEGFALGPYATALLRGSALPDDEREQIAARLARLTGLSPQFVARCDLRVRDDRFVKELLREAGRTVGRLDSRFKGIDRDAAGERAEFDPSLAAIVGPYTAGLNDYVRGELKFESDLPYEVLTDRVLPWRADHENRFIDVAETLRAALSRNPHLRVHVASGYYDLATPYFATDYTISHLGLDPSLRGNVRVSYYEAGHMMYIHRPSLAKLRGELGAFVREAGGMG